MNTDKFDMQCFIWMLDERANWSAKTGHLGGWLPTASYHLALNIVGAAIQDMCTSAQYTYTY